MISYCRDDNVTSSIGWLWTQGAFNQCVFDSSIAVLQLGIMALLGGTELRIYFRYGSAVDALMIGRPPLLYVIQLSLSLLLACIHITRLIIYGISHDIYGYNIVHNGIGIVVWFTSALLIYVERNYDLPMLPRGRHSTYLLLFWLLALLIDTLYLVNVAGSQWFFALKTSTDTLMLVLFIVQWLSEAVTLVLGARAPGILSNLQRSKFIYRPMTGETFSRCSSDEAFIDKYGSLSSSSIGLELSTSSSFAASIEQFKQDIITGDLNAEYDRLPRQSSTASMNIAKRRDNQAKNRYYNVLPYDHNRVVLRHTQNDYINASWIIQRFANMHMTNIYIATQGPLPSTTADFWHLIWQERIPVIVMLTQCKENNIRKCEQYWPELNDTFELQRENLLISCNHQQMPRNKVYTIRDLFIVDTITGQEHSVVHCQMHAWPDHGSPKTAKRLLDFWTAVKFRMPPRRAMPDGDETVSPPVLVHCSAGIGRTGAYILLDTLITSLNAEIPLRPIDILAHFREQRMAMVQTEDQLISACKAAIINYEERRNRSS